MNRIVAILNILVWTGSAEIFAQDSIEPEKKWELNGYIKNLESISFDKNINNGISGNLIHNRLNGKWKPSTKITATVEFRNRLFWGEEVKATPNFVSLLRNEYEKVKLQKVWLQNKSLVLHTNVERLNIEYRDTNWHIKAGRQRINWGIATTWNPNDIFNSYNFLDFDYEERPGVDGAKVQYIFTNSFSTEIAYAQTGTKEANIAALKYNLNKWGYDMQLITAWYKRSVTLGAGWAGNIKDAGFKGEVQYYFRNKDSIKHLYLLLEADYMFKKGWYINVGSLFNNRGTSKPVGDWRHLNFKLSPQNLMPTKWNFIVTAAKELNPLLSANLSVLYAPGTDLMIFLTSFKYNLATNLDADFIWQSFFAEFNKPLEAVNHRGFLRLRWNF